VQLRGLLARSCVAGPDIIQLERRTEETHPLSVCDDFAQSEHSAVVLSAELCGSACTDRAVRMAVRAHAGEVPLRGHPRTLGPASLEAGRRAGLHR
jgi:hypothetical protein